MSAWIVSKKHIDVLVAGAIECGGFDHRGKFIVVSEENASEIGKMLWRENHKSINYRYGERSRTPAYKYATPFDCMVGMTNGRIVDPALLAKQVACYNYQTCEHPGWTGSQAHSLIMMIAYHVMHYVEGYGEAPWGV
jgi:hypothetical protein